ncbi:phage tail assembly chaperone [Oceanibaculum indicum]|uniref:Uncharacterized protein n=1 Tax=Oceanibaculum indicum P24 TaxID=1207063 RepID=K2JSH3_9PROT|nr:phage tail assembly chaperone [Oceanibaculum indicum]EKE78428.1 hypothetical protein P24_02671 [Oceanibaculum indicum P24]
MFTLREELKYELRITVDMPDPEKASRRLKESFYATFRALSISEAEELRRKARSSTEDELAGLARETLREAILGWRDIKDADGKEVPFNDENLTLILDNQFAVTALFDAYVGSLQPESRRNRRLGN